MKVSAREFRFRFLLLGQSRLREQRISILIALVFILESHLEECSLLQLSVKYVDDQLEKNRASFGHVWRFVRQIVLEVVVDRNNNGRALEERSSRVVSCFVHLSLGRLKK